MLAGGAYLWMKHQENKSVLSKGADTWERNKHDALSRAPGTSPFDSAKESAKSTYYDAKKQAQ